MLARGRRWIFSALVACGCAAPALSRDGQLVFSERSRAGAAVLTANGLEIVDKSERPQPVVRKSALEAWRPPTGFLLPKDGVFRATSKPVALEGRGVLVLVRASDAIVPSWGGEILLRIDAIVPASAHRAVARSVRAPVKLAIVIDSAGGDAVELIETLLDATAANDRVVVLDSTGPKRVVPPVPGTHRTLLGGAVERVLASRAGAAPKKRDLGGALAQAKRELGALGDRRVVVVSDGFGVAADRGAAARRARELSASGIRVAAVAATERVDADTLDPIDGEPAVGAFEARRAAVEALLAPPGELVLENLALSFDSAPAPARLLEASSGTITRSLENEELELGDLYVGEARTEVVRIGVPEWQPNSTWRLRILASYLDRTGRERRAKKEIRFAFSDDIEAIAEQRRGDVIAYASALAMVRRLERAFLGGQADEIGGLEGLIRWQARSMRTLAHERNDARLGAQAELLETLLGALGG